MSGVDVGEEVAVMLLKVGFLLNPLLRSTLCDASQLLQLLVVSVLHLLNQLLFVRKRHLQMLDLTPR